MRGLPSARDFPDPVTAQRLPTVWRTAGAKPDWSAVGDCFEDEARGLRQRADLASSSFRKASGWTLVGLIVIATAVVLAAVKSGLGPESSLLLTVFLVVTAGLILVWATVVWGLCTSAAADSRLAERLDEYRRGLLRLKLATEIGDKEVRETLLAKAFPPPLASRDDT